MNLKKKIRSSLSPGERAFSQAWPLINKIDGFLVSSFQEHWLFDAARSLPIGSNVVEIGSHKGRSTCCLAFGCKGKKKHVHAIDTFNGNEVDFPHRNFFAEFASNIEKCGHGTYVTPIIGKSVTVAQNWNKQIDLLFIVGSHEYDDVLADFQLFFPHVVFGGMVALHDVGDGKGWLGPYRAWHEEIKSCLIHTNECYTLVFGIKPKRPSIGLAV